jgi:hypothetical protein
MGIVSDFLSNGLSTLVAPIAGIFQKKEERKIAHDAIIGQLNSAKIAGDQEVVVNDQHLETVLANQLGTTWKDEYVTLSIVGIINAYIAGGILNGFGYPAFLEGVILGVKTMAATGIDVGFIMNATVMAAIGLNIWRKI